MYQNNKYNNSIVHPTNRILPARPLRAACATAAFTSVSGYVYTIPLHQTTPPPLLETSIVRRAALG
jgi:hypothetical protein